MDLGVRHHRRGIWLVALCTAATWLLVGCGSDTAGPVASSSTEEPEQGTTVTEAQPGTTVTEPQQGATVTEPPPATTGAALAPLPRKLVGSWTTEQWLDQSGSQKIVRRYVFSPEGHYSYTIAQCQSSTDCVFVAQESGDAQATHGLLAVEPRTASQDGPRSWPYTVDRDPVVGDVRLVLALAGGQTDIFYRD